MNINKTMNLNFNAKTIDPKLIKITTFSVPGKNGSKIVTSLTETDKKYTNLEYYITKKGEILEEKAYQNKKGFPSKRLYNICENIQTKVRKGYDFLEELIRSQF
jgi:hypothetical protein